MGSFPSRKQTAEQLKARQIDKELMQAQVEAEKIVKMLLLGTGECGKSTILKQMRILHDQGFSAAEKRKIKTAVYNNTVTAMVTLLDIMNTLNIPFDNPDLQSAAKIVLRAVDRYMVFELLSVEVVNAIKALWADKNVREQAFLRGQEFQLNGNAEYFLNSIDRTSQQDYVPTEQDILLIRIVTTGITEVKFKMKTLDFRVFDVGGQRSERKKWIHCFEGVNCVIFLSALSDYDQQLVEDENTYICNCKWFLKTSMILFLNKKDLFAEKIKRKSIKVCFTSYGGADTYEDQIKYIELRFERLCENPDKPIYMHRTCATDTNQVQMIIDSVIEQIIKASLEAGGLY